MKICGWKKMRTRQVGAGRWSLGLPAVEAEVEGQPEYEIPPGACYPGGGDSSYSGESSSFSGYC